jgi:hypothetical protein
MEQFGLEDEVVSSPTTNFDFGNEDEVVQAPTQGQPQFSQNPIMRRMQETLDQNWVGRNLVGPAVSGIVNIPRNIAETVDVVATKALPEGNMVSRGARAITDAIPEADFAPNQGVVGDVVEFGAGMLGGGGVGVKLANMAAKALPTVNTTNKLAKAVSVGSGRLAKGAAFETGGVAATDIDAGTAFIGGNAALGDYTPDIIQNMGFDESGNVDDIRFEKKMNQIVEGLTLAGLGDVAGKVISKVWSGTVGPTASAVKRGVVNLFSPQKAQNDTMTDLVATLARVDPDNDPQGFKDAIARLKEITSDPTKRQHIFEFKSADSRLENVEVKRGTLDLVEDDVAQSGFRGLGMENENVDEIIRLRQFENAVKGSKLAAEELRPNRALQNTLEQTREVFGGESTVKPAAEAITSGLENKYIRPELENVGSLRVKSEDAQQALVDAISTDPFFADLAKDLVKYNPSVGKMADVQGQNLVNRIFANLDYMTKEKNTKFANPIMKEIKGSRKIVNEAIAEIDRLDSAMLPKSVRDRLANSDLSLFDLEEIANFNITDLIGSARNKETYRRADALGRFKQALTKDQIPYLRARHKRGDAAALKAIDDADEYYTKFLPWRTNPILMDVAESRWHDMGLQKPVESMRRVEQGIIESGTETGGSMYTDNMIDFMEREFANGSENVGVLTDFAIRNVAKDAQRILNSSGRLTPENVAPILSKLEKIGPVIQKADPIRYEQMIEFARGLQQNSIDMLDIDKIYGQAVKNLEGMEDRVYNSIAKEFYQRGSNIPLPENYDAFRQFFSSADNVGRIDELLNVVQGNPIAMDGIKSAYTKFLRDDFFSRAGTAVDRSNMLNLNNLREFADPEKGTYQIARKVLGDKYADQLRALVSHVYDVNARTKAGKDAMGIDPKSGARLSKTSVDKIITIVFGPLDRTGARLRTLTGQYVDAANMGNYAKAFIDEVLANPESFNQALVQLEKARTPLLSKQTKDMIYKSLIRGVFRRMGENPAPEPIPFEDQMNGLFGNTEGEVGERSEVPFSTR